MTYLYAYIEGGTQMHSSLPLGSRELFFFSDETSKHNWLRNFSY